MIVPKGWPIFLGKKKKRTQISKQYETSTKFEPTEKEGLEDRLQDADKEKTSKYY